MNTENKNGVSVIICCYNSANRIKRTVDALVAQEFKNDIPWEVVLVDNASIDNTAHIAATLWQESNAPTDLRVVHEPKAGLTYARQKGIATARYSVLLFCDDDNHLNPDYVEGMFNRMHRHPQVAACGGTGIPLFDSKEPAWFKEYQEAYAVGPQTLNEENGRLLNLYGAGMAIQRKALENLYEAGFTPILTGRMGSKLSSAEDIELTYAFVLMGYQLHYIPDLKFFHYLPSNRLNKEYLHKLFRAFGTDGPIRNLYYGHISDRYFHKRLTNWYFHLLLSFYRLVKYLIVPPKRDAQKLYLGWNMAYLKQLVRMRRDYKTINRKILQLRDKVPTMYAVKDIPEKANYSRQL